MCCKLTEVPEISKPVGVWCPDCKIGDGCGSYDSRPASCKSFSCDWLLNEKMKDDLRPDRCGVIFERVKDDLVLVLKSDGSRELSKRVLQIMRDIVYRGLSVAVSGRPMMIIPHKETTFQAVADELQAAVKVRQEVIV